MPPTLNGFPVPVPDADTQPFWDAASEGRLVVQRCRSCSQWLWQPRPLCSYCGSLDLAWEPVAGTGHVVTWTVPRPPLLPVLADLVPFVIAVVELSEGVRMIGLLVDPEGLPLRSDGTDANLEVGSPVQVVFRDQDGFRQPGWALT